MQSPELALVDAVVLMAVIFLMILRYARIDRIAGVMLVPYACWMCLATAINLWIVLHN
jgi:tryptophan-rich sensory protein